MKSPPFFTNFHEFFIVLKWKIHYHAYFDMFIDFFIKNLAIITYHKSSFEMKLEVLSIGKKNLD